MAEERADRRFATILAADVVGYYGRLMEQNEADTFTRLKSHGRELLGQEIAKHHGHVFKVIGDGLLAVFGSVVDAMECAVFLQRAMAERNSGAADDPRIGVRIGIDFGDVIVEGEDRRGEGVTIAAGLQQLAGVGGICLSRTVYDHVKNKLALAFESLGEHQFETVAGPVAAYRIVAEDIPEPILLGLPPRGEYWV